MPRTRRKIPIPVECLARRLIAELEKWPREWPSADVEQVRVALGLTKREITLALVTASERAWVSIRAAKGEAFPSTVSLRDDGWVEAVRQREGASAPPKD